jgi:hypothetical protein
MQIMTPKARSDVHVNLPALQKLDAMLIVCCQLSFSVLVLCICIIRAGFVLV